MNVNGFIGTKSTEIFAYANDVARVSRNKIALQVTTVNMESVARKWDLLIN
jgi:hypothetical protein